MTANNNTNILIHAFAKAAWVNEFNVHQGMLEGEAPETFFARCDKCRRVEKLVSDKLEEVTGSRPEFFDQGSFFEGHGFIVFQFGGIMYEYDNERLTVCDGEYW